VVFTGDVLLIRGSGRTDFQGGDARASWNSIVHKLFELPDETTMYPAHDYKGWTASSIGEERRHNPRLANKTEAQYVAIMHALVLPNPALMDVAVPANLACGRA
jgi:glyoxylase-like metal-dependent hydrolase (beta-lactamase superfamily II)